MSGSSLSTDPHPARAVTHDTDRGVRSYAFCHDDRHLLYVQDRDGDESWRLYVLDLETDEATLVTPGAGVQARIVAHNRWHPDEVLVAINDRDPQLHDLHLLDLRTLELRLVLENPGFVDWLDRHRPADPGRDDDGRRRRPRRPPRPGRQLTSRTSRSPRTTPSRPGSGASPGTASALLVLSSIGVERRPGSNATTWRPASAP